jgi:hypothetical protein
MLALIETQGWLLFSSSRTCGRRPAASCGQNQQVGAGTVGRFGQTHVIYLFERNPHAATQPLTDSDGYCQSPDCI